MDFKALVAAHETSMELVEFDPVLLGESDPKTPKSPHPCPSTGEVNGENKHHDQAESNKGSSKLIEEEERETGKVGLNVYKQYLTKAFGWWGVIAALLLSLVWQGSQMAGDYWLAYETSADRASSFKPSRFIAVYAIIAAVSLILITIRAFFIAVMGPKVAQIFFKGILHSILHAPMSYFDTTPSGRIFRASTDQTNINLFLPFVLGTMISTYVTLLGIIVITCQYISAVALNTSENHFVTVEFNTFQNEEWGPLLSF